MQFYFIRHGQSSNNLLYQENNSDHGRSDDPELTEVGRTQAFLVAEHLRTKLLNPMINPDVHEVTIYSSLMTRAVETSMIISKELKSSVIAHPDLHEGGGIYLDDPVKKIPIGQAGKDRHFFELNYPSLSLPDTVNAEGWWNREYESIDEQKIRAQRVIKQIWALARSEEKCILFVSHMRFYNVLMSKLFGYSLDEKWMRLNNAGITRIDFMDDRCELIFANRTSYLLDSLVTL